MCSKPIYVERGNMPFSCYGTTKLCRNTRVTGFANKNVHVTTQSLLEFGLKSQFSKIYLSVTNTFLLLPSSLFFKNQHRSSFFSRFKRSDFNSSFFMILKSFLLGLGLWAKLAKKKFGSFLRFVPEKENNALWLKLRDYN